MSQADQNISNDTGSNVELTSTATCLRCLAITQARQRPQPLHFMWWADTSQRCMMKIRNAADDGFGDRWNVVCHQPWFGNAG